MLLIFSDPAFFQQSQGKSGRDMSWRFFARKNYIVPSSLN